MQLFLILVCVLSCTGYRFQLKANENGRFVYTGHNGEHRYCTTCQTGQNDKENFRTQQGDCIRQNFGVPLHDGRNISLICKEGTPGAMIPGCGPLPTSGELSWSTESGRPVQVNSMVYEVYHPRCSHKGIMNRDLRSIRCGEDLRWNASIRGLRCLYGCGTFPAGLTWRLMNGNGVGNESLLGETYISECSPGHKRSMVMYCGLDSRWHTNYTTLCETDECEQWYCSVEILIGCSLGALLAILCVVACLYIRYTDDAHSPSSKIPTTPETDEESRMIGRVLENETNRLPSECSTDTEETFAGSPTPEENECHQFDRWPSINTTSTEYRFSHSSNENIRVFPALRTDHDADGNLRFTIQKGEMVYIATKEKLNESDCLQIWRPEGDSYRGVAMHPFLHVISSVNSGDSGIYFWRTDSSSKERYKFYLEVDDRGQPDGWESSSTNLLANAGSSGDVHEDHTEYHSSVSNPCFAGMYPSLSEASLLNKDINKGNFSIEEPVCGLQIDTIYREQNWETFRKHLCACLDSSASGEARACWREIARKYLNRTEAYLSSVEWHKEDDTDDGPAHLILDDLRTAYRAITIGQLAANLPPNSELINCISTFHHDCAFCIRLYNRMHQTRPKDVHGEMGRPLIPF